MKRIEILCLIFFFIISIFLRPVSLQAKDFTVNSTFDVNDLSPGNGLCVAYLIIVIPSVYAVCTLRAAIEEANGYPGKDTITLSSGTYSLSKKGREEDLSLTGDLDITESLTIIGEGADVTFIDADGIDRIIDILSPDVTLTLKGLSIVNGSVGSAQTLDGSGGGGIRNSGTLVLENVGVKNSQVLGVGGENSGGGIQNFGDIFLFVSAIENNNAHEGGGIANSSSGSMHITSSSVTTNEANKGGGILNHGWAEMKNSTISANRAEMYGSAAGGGIYNTGVFKVIQSTIVENSSVKGGGLVNRDTLYLQNSIVAMNQGDDCLLGEYLISWGSNLIGDNSCDLSSANNDITNIDPHLWPLSLNSLGTRSHSLILGSPAIDAGQEILGLLTDQRGHRRPKGGGYDIGSVESENFSVLPILSPLLLK